MNSISAEQVCSFHTVLMVVLAKTAVFFFTAIVSTINSVQSCNV